jgi:hypothetical protein
MDHAMVEGLEEEPGREVDSPAVQTFFEGMAWPIPIAFSGAIAAMRFEQGDVLYRVPRAYDTLEGQIPKGLSAIQVILPKRSARATPSESDGDRRQSNWQSEVTVELIDLARGQTEKRVLTQGKLAMAVFRGEDAWLEPDREEPPMPRSARVLQQRLEQTLTIFDARQTARRGCRFIFAVDLASDASRTKAAGVEESLRATGALERIELSAEQAGVEDAQTYHPTAVVRCLVMPNRTTEEVLPILRDRLYGGASERVGDSDRSDDSDSSEGVEGTPDRFSVGRHGILQAIPTEPAATRSKSSRS